jgi:hypothetical protein
MIKRFRRIHTRLYDRITAWMVFTIGASVSPLMTWVLGTEHPTVSIMCAVLGVVAAGWFTTYGLYNSRVAAAYRELVEVHLMLDNWKNELQCECDELLLSQGGELIQLPLQERMSMGEIELTLDAYLYA